VIEAQQSTETFAAELSTTEIYTRVSIKHLKAVHDRTHPGAKLRRRSATSDASDSTDHEESSP
jgi:hypothetical protein